MTSFFRYKAVLIAIGRSRSISKFGCSPGGDDDTLPEKKAPGWLGYIGDEKLPNYMGIIS